MFWPRSKTAVSPGPIVTGAEAAAAGSVTVRAGSTTMRPRPLGLLSCPVTPVATVIDRGRRSQRGISRAVSPG